MMEKSQNTALLYSLQDYIGAFRILDALPYSAIRPEHVKPFSFVRRRVHHSVNKKDEDIIEDIKEKQKYGWLTRICKKL